MQRRKFIKDTALAAFAVGVLGKIIWSKDHFVGDTPTTTDLLGPFYRPNAPIRTNINPPDFKGITLHLSGTIYKEDGITPFKKCRVEIWQCDENRLYDNISDDFKYRGTQYTGADGKYSFITTKPVPYPIPEDPDIFRPAHIHLLFSGEDQQDLITQIYLKGDPNLETDLASASPKAVNRILTIEKNGANEDSLVFDVILAKEYKPDHSVYEKLSGTYRMNDKSLIEFYEDGDLLFLNWGGQIREGLSYKGNNEFAGGVNKLTTAKFELLTGNEVKVKVHYFAAGMKKEYNLEGLMAFKYKK